MLDFGENAIFQTKAHACFACAGCVGFKLNETCKLRALLFQTSSAVLIVRFIDVIVAAPCCDVLTACGLGVYYVPPAIMAFLFGHRNFLRQFDLSLPERIDHYAIQRKIGWPDGYVSTALLFLVILALQFLPSEISILRSSEPVVSVLSSSTDFFFQIFSVKNPVSE
jgi:hypothetical protein